MARDKAVRITRRLLKETEKYNGTFCQAIIKEHQDKHYIYSYCYIYCYLGLKQGSQAEISKKLIQYDLQSEETVHSISVIENVWGKKATKSDYEDHRIQADSLLNLSPALKGRTGVSRIESGA